MQSQSVQPPGRRTGMWSSRQRSGRSERDLAIRAAGLPLPIANLPLDTPRGRFVMDAYWPRRHVAYELDWRQDHDRPPTRARDKAREDAFDDERIPFIRIDVDDMYADVDRQVARVARLLGL